MIKKNKIQVIDVVTGLLNVLGNKIYSTKDNNFKMTLRAKVVIILSLASFFIRTVSLYVNWNDNHRRLLIIQDIVGGGNTIVSIYGLIYSPKIFTTLLDIIKYSIKFKTKKYYQTVNQSIVDNINNEMSRLSWNIIRFMFVGLLTYWIFVCIIPFCVLLFNVFNNFEIDINNTDSPVPSFNAIINEDNNLIVFIINFIIQIIVYTISCLVIGTWLLLLSLSLVQVSYELRLLSCIILNIDNYIRIVNGTGTDKSILEMESYDLNLKNFMRNIYQHHLRALQKTNDINKLLGFSLLVFNQLICLHYSVMLYCIFKSEDLRNAIALCSWQNKPLWFKQSIKMCLTATMNH
ncbi:uncharacterized protein LOC142333223 isoform X2 [Lycorma delicatula]|uniref:uncharacterized protein LOC142333223 isoform X2 n=1 Tax=Lycorma delicatula TaxID=130591 RepID=UPI003F513B90